MEAADYQDEGQSPEKPEKVTTLSPNVREGSSGHKDEGISPDNKSGEGSQENKGSVEIKSGSGGGSQERMTRSKLQYEADPEDLELRQKLLESKMARKKTEEDAKVLMNRLLLLKNEEQKVNIG